jgi:hypothetical protein
LGDSLDDHLLTRQNQIRSRRSVDLLNLSLEGEGIACDGLDFEKLVVADVAVVGGITLKIYQQDFVIGGKTRC